MPVHQAISDPDGLRAVLATSQPLGERWVGTGRLAGGRARAPSLGPPGALLLLNCGTAGPCRALTPTADRRPPPGSPCGRQRSLRARGSPLGRPAPPQSNRRFAAREGRSDGVLRQSAACNGHGKPGRRGGCRTVTASGWPTQQPCGPPRGVTAGTFTASPRRPPVGLLCHGPFRLVAAPLRGAATTDRGHFDHVGRRLVIAGTNPLPCGRRCGLYECFGPPLCRVVHVDDSHER
jgi:hypothetical protein